MCQLFDIDTIWNDPRLAGVGPVLYLVVLVHASNRDDRIGYLIGHALHKTIDIQPPLLKKAQALVQLAMISAKLVDPGGLDDFYFTLSRIDTMLGQQKR